jgi:hypothetical protein
MTPQQHADRFVARYNGEYIDEDHSYGSQCWDVVARYAREEFGCTPFPTVSGGAEGLWRFYGDPRSAPIFKYFDQVPAADLKPGDIVVWNASFYPPYGHTALVWRREGNTIFVLEQDGSKDPNGDGNADGVSYIAQRTITSKVAGGLRPKGAYMYTKEQAVYLAQRIGLLAGMSEAEITASWLDYHSNNIMADLNYPAALCKQLYEGDQWQKMAYKSVHYAEDVKSAYEKGKAEGGGDDTFIPVAEVDGKPTLFAKIPKGDK